MISRLNRKYGWRPSLPSRRFPRLSLTSYPPLAPKFSLDSTGFDPPIWDQGQTGSCTGHGSTRAIAYARAKQGLPYIDLSRIFTYWNARVAEGTEATDAGATVEDVIVAAQQFGDCPYSDYPTDVALVTTAPSASAFTDAIPHKALSATRVWGANDLGLAYHVKHCISILNLPVVFGFTVYESFESDEVASSGIVPIPGPNEQILGGHCVVVIGYDDATGYAECDNSWGTDWGQVGRFQLPYQIIFNSEYSNDFHTIQLES
jgi:C1A family cysteine protease